MFLATNDHFKKINFDFEVLSSHLCIVRDRYYNLSYLSGRYQIHYIYTVYNIQISFAKHT